ncbi:hydrophobin [Rhizopogon salebrosus TDB-379]|nr:hydrophobin [Rhizopogon salebrosus TDB-379]
MFVRLLSITSFVILAIATPQPHARGLNECNTGNIGCCGRTETVEQYNEIAGLLGLTPIVGNVIGDVGIDCTPITVVGLSQGATCAQEPVCCSSEKYNGVINVGCSPLNLHP